MVSDPRCPSCSEKVGLTARWCMHCGADFEQPVDAETGQTAETPDRARTTGTDADGVIGQLTDGDTGPKAVGVALAVAALVTIPLVAPANATALYLIAVAGVGFYAAQQPTASDAATRGLRALAIAPFAIWLFSPLVVGFGAFSPAGIVGPIVYGLVVRSVLRRID